MLFGTHQIGNGQNPTLMDHFQLIGRGYGAVLRNSAGALLAAVAVQDQTLSSINVLEFKAILQGLKLAQSLSLSKVFIESDSSTAIAWVRGRAASLGRLFVITMSCSPS
ncbi:hypothetical protein QJS04_geneDACA023443 [Acorus gramineus]|uniref:RNase H type-1 domain-containing protein n=1 Tax=Acorus gramineus TaxID=55184 RepID=A0AAV9A8V3_ACOGR|nr:hypothetical protein QJS04_geneDACA023443 [Acorus gramineus]